MKVRGVEGEQDRESTVPCGAPVLLTTVPEMQFPSLTYCGLPVRQSLFRHQDKTGCSPECRYLPQSQAEIKDVLKGLPQHLGAGLQHPWARSPGVTPPMEKLAADIVKYVIVDDLGEHVTV